MPELCRWQESKYVLGIAIDGHSRHVTSGRAVALAGLPAARFVLKVSSIAARNS